MWALLAAIVVISLTLAVVTAARRELLAKSQQPSSPCRGCAPCRHTCPCKETA